MMKVIIMIIDLNYDNIVMDENYVLFMLFYFIVPFSYIFSILLYLYIMYIIYIIYIIS